MKRPLMMVALLYAGGILLGECISAPLWLLLTTALSLTVLALLWARARAILLCLALFLAGWANLNLQEATLSPYDLRRVLLNEPVLGTVRGVVAQTPTQRMFIQDAQETWRTLSQIEVTALRPNRAGWQPARGRIAVITPGLLTNVFAGQVVEVTGVAHVPKLAAAEGTFDYRSYLSKLGIYYQLDAASEQDWQIVHSPSRPPLADRFRSWARQALALGLPAEDESLRLEWALTLGWKPALTEEVSEPFVRAATYHIFAVDGLRMAIIFGIFFGLFRAFNVPRWACGLILIPLIWFYTALTGWPASAVRATVMLTIIICGWVLKRPSDLMNSLFAAALIILIWQPSQLFQAGFQLSFVVVLCLILSMPRLHELWHRLWAPDPLLPEALRPRWRKVLRVPGGYTMDVLLTSFAAWIGSIPLVAYYFHIVTPVSTPANLLAVPLCGLVLMSNLGSLLLAGWFPGAAILFNHAGWFLMECIRVSSHWFAAWPKAFFYVPAPSLFTSALYYGLLLAILSGWLFRPKLRFYKVVALVLAGSVWSWIGWHDLHLTRVHIVPLNGGFCVYCDAPGTHDDLLVDCGNTNSVALVTKPFLQSQGVNQLSNFALTHGDSRHISGATLLRRLFAVKQIWVSRIRFRSRAYRQFMNELGTTPGKLRTLARNDQVNQWTVLHPEPEDRFTQADDNPLVLYGTIHGARLLLLSDLSQRGQRALLQRMPDLRADIVVTGQPTQTEALCDDFLNAVRPRLVVVADSDYPVWERASPRLCERLHKRMVPFLCTRETGAATIEFGRNNWKVHTISGYELSSH